MRSYLEMLNVPTREDIARLGELIVGMEEKLDQLDDRLSRIEELLVEKLSASEPSGKKGGSSAESRK